MQLGQSHLWARHNMADHLLHNYFTVYLLLTYIPGLGPSPSTPEWSKHGKHGLLHLHVLTGNTRGGCPAVVLHYTRTR